MLNINKNIANTHQDKHVKNISRKTRKLSFAYAPTSKWRIIEGKPTIRELFLKTSRRLIKRKIRKRRRRRMKNNLPCNINKIYLMKAGHLSNKEFTEQCSTRSMQCKKANPCYVHEGRKNLKKLRNMLLKIKPDHMGWKTGIKWNIEKGGFLETLFNFQYLREELLQTKRKSTSLTKIA